MTTATKQTISQLSTLKSHPMVQADIDVHRAYIAWDAMTNACESVEWDEGSEIWKQMMDASDALVSAEKHFKELTGVGWQYKYSPDGEFGLETQIELWYLRHMPEVMEPC